MFCTAPHPFSWGRGRTQSVSVRRSIPKTIQVGSNARHIMDSSRISPDPGWSAWHRTRRLLVEVPLPYTREPKRKSLTQCSLPTPAVSRRL